jgi:hypothetical protein
MEGALVVEDRRLAVFADELTTQGGDVEDDVWRGAEPHVAHLEADRLGTLRLGGR